MYRQSGEVAIRAFREEDIDNKIEWINNPSNNSFLHYDIPLERDKTYHWFLQRTIAVGRIVL